AADFDKQRLWLVLADVGGARPKLRKLASAPAPEGLDFTSAADVGKWIGGVASEHGMTGAPLVMAAPRSRVILRHLALPPGTLDGEVAGIVRFQIDMDLPFAPGEAVVDYTLDEKPLPAVDARAGG